MPDKAIALISAGGFFGKKIAAIAKEQQYNVIPTYFPKREENCGIELDATKREAVKRFVAQAAADTVINCSAITAVDWCEQHRRKCFDVNVVGAKNIALACKANGKKMVHFSTGFVFDGNRQLYREGDSVKPLNVYAESKAESEKVVMKTISDYLIIRTIDLYGFNNENDPQCFVTWVLQKLRQGKQFAVVKDRFTQPTLIDELAAATMRLIELNARGVFHVVGSQYISKYKLALKTADTFGFDKKLLKPIATAELQQKAKRPILLRLSTKKAQKLGIKMHGIKEGLRLMKQQMQVSKFQ